jgi:hypothetical protein
MVMHTRRAEDFHERLPKASVALFAETGYQGTGVKIVEPARLPDWRPVDHHADLEARRARNYGVGRTRRRDARS